MESVMKKSLSFILALLFCLLSVTSCGEPASDPAGDVSADAGDSVAEAPAAEETEPAETELSDDLPDTDLAGYEFRIFSEKWSDGVEAASRIMADEYNGEVVNDALCDSTMTVEERFNCSIVMLEGGDPYEMEGNTKTIILAGDDGFDIAVGHDGIMRSMGTQGMFYNMKDIEQFNFDKPWWTPTMELEYCGQLFFASTYLSHTNLHWTRALMFNKDFMTNLNIEFPYDTVREGKWTFDAMTTLVEGTFTDVDGNGTYSTGDKLGFSTGCETLYCLQESLDLSAYTRMDDGSMALDFDLERADTALSKLRALASTPDFYYNGSSQFTAEVFETGNSLMVLGQIGDAYTTYRACDFNYGFLPCPKLDEMQENYINCCTDMPWAIPKTISESQGDIIGTIVEALSCYNYKNVLPAYFEVAMKSRTADSPDDAEMLQLIADTRTISFAYTYGLTYNEYLGDLLNSNAELASYYQSNLKVANKTLEKLTKSFMEMP